MQNIRNEATDRLCSALLQLKTEEEAAAFLEDICTIKEMQDLAQRLCTAVSLHQGKNYQEISKEIGVSTATISRVNRCMQYGSGGYRLVIERLEEEK